MDLDAIAGSGSGFDNQYSPVILDILDPFVSSKNTTIRSLAGKAQTNPLIHMESGFWMNTAAVTSITIDGDYSSFVAGSRFSLYGLRK